MAEHTLHSGPEITLPALLESRDDRAAFQRTLTQSYGQSLVSFTVNMPGPVKRSAASQRIFEAGVRAIRERLAGCILYSKLRDKPTGFEGYFVAEMDAPALKALMCRIEAEHPLGRLMDIDVLGSDGAILSRETVGLAPRACLICGKPGPGCARSRAHSVADMLAHIDRLLTWQP